MRLFFLFIVGWFVASPVQAQSLGQAIEAIEANVIFMRHALAPGFGDPENFDIERCETQRNLDAQGREQARAMGQLMRDQGLEFTEIRSSRWCRCTETAELLELGDWRTFDGLNSFFQGHVSRAETLDLLQEYLKNRPADELALLVTHQVVISSITGISPPSGGLVLFNTQTQKARRWVSEQ